LNAPFSAQREDFYNVTQQVRDAVSKSGVANGIAVVYCPHTTAGMTINENADPDGNRSLASLCLDNIYPQYIGNW